MKSKVKKILASITVDLCEKSSKSVSVSACYVGYFQPKEPKCLKKEE